MKTIAHFREYKELVTKFPKLTPEQVKSIKDNADNSIHCTLKEFRLSLDHGWKFPLNQEAAYVFSDSLLRAFQGGKFADKKISEHLLNERFIQELFRTHLRYLQSAYRLYSKNDKHAIVAVRDARNNRASRNSRRDTVSTLRSGCRLRSHMHHRVFIVVCGSHDRLQTRRF